MIGIGLYIPEIIQHADLGIRINKNCNNSKNNNVKFRLMIIVAKEVVY